jgi:ribosomal subunit interface protein
MIINIKATNIEMTDALKAHATKKAEALEKYFDNIQKIDIDFGMDNTHHQKGKIYYAEMNVYIPGKNIYIKKESEDLYKAIDKVKDHLKVEFEKVKGKKRKLDKKMLRDNKGYQE